MVNQNIATPNSNSFNEFAGAVLTRPESGGDGGFMDFLTRSFIDEDVLNTIREAGFFGRLGANVLGELTNPIGIASTALLATGVGAPLGAGLRAATAGTRLALAGRLGASALTPVATSARGLGPSAILRSPGILGRSLAAETGVAAGAIAGGGAAQEAGQLVPGPTRSVPGQLGLGLAGGVVGGGLSANSLNRVLDPDVTRQAAIARVNPIEQEIPGLALIRKNFQETFKTNEQIAAELAVERAGQTRRSFEAEQAAANDPISRQRAARAGLRGELIDRQRFRPLATDETLSAVTQEATDAGIIPETFRAVLERAESVYPGLGAQHQRNNARDAVIDLMLGKVPQPAKMELLRPVIGDAFVDQIRTVTRGRGRRAVEEILQIGAIPRSVAASFDLSSVLRQGGPLNIAHPRLAAKSFKEGIKAIRNREYALELNQKHISDPDVQFVNSGLDQQDQLYLHSIEAPTIATRDETFISENISNAFGIRHSEQFFATDLNVLRVGLLKQRLKDLREVAPEVFRPENADRLLAWKKQNNRVINSLTGRGSLGFLERPSGNRAEQINLIRDVLSASFWSPRLLVSRFQSVAEAVRAGRNIRATDPEIRQLSREIAKDIAIYAGGVTGAISLLALTPGIDVEANPKSSDFGKVRIGNTRLDPWAGFQQVGRYATQFITGERKSVTTGEIAPVYGGRAEVLGRFLRSKLAPGLPSLTASDLPDDFVLAGLTGGGENFIGEPITGGNVTPGAGIRFLSGEAFGGPGVGDLPAEMNVLIDQMVPLLAQDIAEALESGGYISGTAAGVGSTFGLGSTSFGDNTRTELVNDERQAASAPQTSILNRAFR